MTGRNMLTALAVIVAVLGLVNFWTETVPVFATQPFAMLALGFMVLRRVLPAVMLGPPGEQPPSTAPPFAEARCSGSVGAVRLQGMLKVTAYPDRLVLRVLLVGSRTIMTSELMAVQEHQWSVRLDHVSAGVKSPVLLYVQRSHPLRQAIAWLWYYRPPPLAHAVPVPRPDPVRTFVIVSGLVGTVAVIGFGIYMLTTGITFGIAFIAIALLAAGQLLWWARRTR